MDSSYFVSVFSKEPEATGFAPGRIEFIGNHTDYNGGRVMGLSLNLGTRVDISKREDTQLIIHSREAKASASLELSELSQQCDDLFWVNHVIGVIDQLAKLDMPISCGLNITISSNLPIGAGLGSSAALQLATACALAKGFSLSLDKDALVQLALRVENEFVGMPCGMFDQTVSVYGDTNKIVRLDCHTGNISTLPLSEDLELFIFNTQKQHNLVESLYADRRDECSDALELLRPVLQDAPCLAHVNPDDIIEHRELLTADLFARARHVTEENDRVRAVENSLACNDIGEVGRLLFASHQSSRRLFMNSSDEQDFLVDRLEYTQGIYGARLSGGGWGGAVLALADKDFANSNTAERLMERYEKRFGHKPMLLRVESGPGAHAL